MDGLEAKTTSKKTLHGFIANSAFPCWVTVNFINKKRINKKRGVSRELYFFLF